MVNVDDAWLFEETGSGSDALTYMESEADPAVAWRIWRVIVVEVFAGRLPEWQSRTVVPEQVPADDVAETSMPVEGSVAATVMSDAADGPWLVIVAV